MTCPVCGGPMPRTALSTCSWPCALVRKGVFTLEQIQPWLALNRPPITKDAAA